MTSKFCNYELCYWAVIHISEFNLVKCMLRHLVHGCLSENWGEGEKSLTKV
jgi:hypothetical protein